MYEVKFRSLYAAAVLSIHRQGEPVGGGSRLGRVVLRAGDELLLDMGDDFDWQQQHTKRDLSPVIPAKVAAHPTLSDPVTSA